MTVHFAGHEVPAYQPEKALQMFEQYLEGPIFHKQSSFTTTNEDNVEGGKELSILIAVALVITLLAVLSFVTLQKSNHSSIENNNSN